MQDYEEVGIETAEGTALKGLLFRAGVEMRLTMRGRVMG